MATFADTFEEELESEESVEEEQQVEEPAQEEIQEPEIPEKYKGKSTADVIKMHQELEKLNGRQAQEVGELRKLTDEYLKRELYKTEAVQPPKEDKIDYAQRLYEDPIGVVNETVDKHPAITEAKKQAESFKQQQVLQRLTSQFPDWETTVSKPEFADWVKSSPIRMRLFAEANSQYDFDSAAELLSTWNVLNPVKQTKELDVVSEAKKETAKNLKAATVDTGSLAPSSKKTYRRSDLINLRLRDPDRYYAMQDEIMSAYAEGRVK